MITPHGGQLVNRYADRKQKSLLHEKASAFESLYINKEELNKINNIASGLFSPLEGFMCKQDYNKVLEEMRLSSGEIWSLPVVLGVSPHKARNLKTGQKIALYFEKNRKLYAVLHLEEKYIFDIVKEARAVFGTVEQKHPGVARLYERDKVLLGGKITMLKPFFLEEYNKYNLSPLEIRDMVSKKDWETVVGFQTRNPIHRAHEYIQKCALEIVDGLLVSPLVGHTKKDDISAEVRMKCYQQVLSHYFPEERVIMAVFPAKMHYAGPREAVFHALCRKNIGCSHFIVGRDHAGVRDYYGTYEAQEIFSNFSVTELGINIMKFDYAFYCKKCQAMATRKTCPHEKGHIYLSGTRVRELLRSGEKPPLEMTRPEVAELLIAEL